MQVIFYSEGTGHYAYTITDKDYKRLEADYNGGYPATAQDMRNWLYFYDIERQEQYFKN